MMPDIGIAIIFPVPLKEQSLKNVCVPPPAIVAHVVGNVNNPEKSQLLICVLYSLNVELTNDKLPMNFISFILTRVDMTEALPIVTLPVICVV